MVVATVAYVNIGPCMRGSGGSDSGRERVCLPDWLRSRRWHP